jgi:hypothetical protein
VAGCGPGDEPVDREELAFQRPPDVEQEAQRVRPGMTKAQVVAILGEPRNRVGEPNGERLTFWSFDTRQQVTARVYVTFDNRGNVIDVETVPL